MTLYDPTRIFPIEEHPYLPGPRFGGANDNGVTNAEALVAEPIRDRRLADHHPRATARIMVTRLLRNALRDCLGKYHASLRGFANVDDLREPTADEAELVRARIAQESHLAEAFRRIAVLRGMLVWLDNLDSRDGIERTAVNGNTYPGLSMGPALSMPFRPVGIR